MKATATAILSMTLATNAAIAQSMPETFVVERIARDHLSRLTNLFQDAFRWEGNPPKPRILYEYSAGDCKLHFVAKVHNEDKAKKWDNTIDQDAPVATRMTVDLRKLIPDATRIAASRFPNDDRPWVYLYFNHQFRGLIWWQGVVEFNFMYGTKNTWEPSRCVGPSGTQEFNHLNPPRPFESVIILGNEVGTGFGFTENERAKVIDILKELFGKCVKS